MNEKKIGPAGHPMGGGPVSPLVSIVVLAYNQLEYTKQCIESISRYTPHIDYELITVDNGSSDGTREYFNGLPHIKKIGFPVNAGIDKAFNEGFRAAEGRYVALVSNDIVVTARWLDNLLACLESDERIGLVVPVCNASCNYQQMTIPYVAMEDIQRFAESWNVSDPSKWEERLKLCTYAALVRKELLDALGGFDEDFNPGSYDDDALCFGIRRMGYKVIFARDAFVHHYGLRTFNEECVRDPNLMMRNKMRFMSKYKADPYVAGLIDFNVLNLLECGGDGVCILGVGKSYGTTPLQLKNVCRAQGSRDVRLYYLSESPTGMADLKTICDDCRMGSIADAGALFGGRPYDYVVVESQARDIPDREAAFSGLYRLLKAGGQLVCTAGDEDMRSEIEGIFERLGARINAVRAGGLVYLRCVKA
jgi:GT2 family glycosyltransferase